MMHVHGRNVTNYSVDAWVLCVPIVEKYGDFLGDADDMLSGILDDGFVNIVYSCITTLICIKCVR